MIVSSELFRLCHDVELGSEWVGPSEVGRGTDVYIVEYQAPVGQGVSAYRLSDVLRKLLTEGVLSGRL